MRYFSLFFTLTLLLGFTGAARAEWSLDGGADLAYESNLSHADDKNDRKADFSLQPYFSASHHYQLSAYSRLSLSAQGKADVFNKYDQLNSVSGKITASVRNKLGLGGYAPWISFYGTGGALSANQSLRNSFIATAGTTFGKRLKDRIDLQAGYEYEHDAARSTLFTQNTNQIHINLDFLLTDTASLAVGYALRRGDIVSYYHDEEDPLSPGEVRLNTFGIPMIAERIRATTHSFQLALLFVINDNVSAKLSGQRCETVFAGRSYLDDVIRLGILYSY